MCEKNLAIFTQNENKLQLASHITSNTKKELTNIH
jgi:hypothetical protein